MLVTEAYINTHLNIPANLGAYGQTAEAWADMMSAQVNAMLANGGTGLAEHLAGLAQQISGILDNPIAEDNRTVAVLATSQGPILVAAGGYANLTAAQIDEAVSMGLEPVKAYPSDLKVHAEIKVLDMAYQNGLSPVALGASKPICGECTPKITATGGIVSGNIAVWP